MNCKRAIAIWLLIVVAESVHGVIRQLFIAPILGDLPARQLGVFIGSVLILLTDYNMAQGGLMGFGLLFLLFAPTLGARLCADVWPGPNAKSSGKMG